MSDGDWVEWVSRLVEGMEEVKERVARVETKVEAIEKRVDNIERLLARRNGAVYKYTTMILAMVLSFLAALLGVGWKPP